MPEQPKTASALLERYAFLMRVLGVLYFLGGLVYLLLPTQLFYALNFVPKMLSALEPLPDAPVTFWNPLALALCWNLSALSFAAAARPANRALPWIHLLTKFVSGLGFAYLFFFAGPRAFGYAAAMGFETVLALVLLWYIARVGYELRKPPASASGGAPAPVASGIGPEAGL